MNMFKFKITTRETKKKEKEVEVEINPPPIVDAIGLFSSMFASSSKKKINSGCKKSYKKH